MRFPLSHHAATISFPAPASLVAIPNSRESPRNENPPAIACLVQHPHTSS